MGTIRERNGGSLVAPAGFLSTTNDALALVEEWTESEALDSWFFLCGLNPEVVQQVNEHIMRTRAALDRLLGDTDPCAGGRCTDPEAHAEGGHDR